MDAGPSPISGRTSRPTPCCRRRNSALRTPARLLCVYAETLLALARQSEALQWFINSAAADLEGMTDAEERVTDLS